MPSDVICTITRSYPKLLLEENNKNKKERSINGKTMFEECGKYKVVTASSVQGPMATLIDDCDISTSPVRAKVFDRYERFTTKTEDEVCDREDGDQNRDDVEPLKINPDKGTNLTVNLSKEFDSGVLIESKTDIETEKWKDENDKAIAADKIYDKNPQEENEDDSCIVDCLYYTLRCCECSIM